MTTDEALKIIKMCVTSVQADYDNRCLAIEAVKTIETALAPKPVEAPKKP